jgi:SSS family solute:Na+ symporter
MSAVGIYTIKKINNSSDFTLGGKKASPILIAGVIVGACVGSGGTIGTAQAAYRIGIVAWWQTLGLGIGCLILGIGLANVMYKMNVETAPQLLESNFGPLIRPLTAIFGSIAIFLSILSQTLGFLPLLRAMIPISNEMAAVIATILILLFVFFGGYFATSLGGLLKIFIILGSLLISGIIALTAFGGFGAMLNAFPDQPNTFNMFARGVGTDLAIGAGFIMGILVTQTYIQAILSAKDPKAARNGAIIAACFTIPVGLFGVFVGLYMRNFYPVILDRATDGQTFPLFMIDKFPPIIAGIFIGGLMLAALGSNAALVFGVSTMLSRDVYKKARPNAGDKEMLYVLRVLILIAVVLSSVFAVTRAGTLIQQFIFLSFGMRTCVFLVPMLFAFFYKKRMTHAAGIAAVLAGPITTIVWNLGLRSASYTAHLNALQNPTAFEAVMKALHALDPLYAGLLAALLAFIIANEIAKRRNPIEAIAQ